MQVCSLGFIASRRVCMFDTPKHCPLCQDAVNPEGMAAYIADRFRRSHAESAVK
jgi:hypothetical protein